MPDDQDLDALSVLSDAQRRRVFQHVQGAADCTVTEVAQALGIGRTLATFHLGKLVDAGLVDVGEPQRQAGARGRPSQRYRPSSREVSVTVPDRRYDLLASILLDAVAEQEPGESAQTSALRSARRRGAELAEQQRSGRIGRTTAARFGRLERLLTTLGYSPRREGSSLSVRNCPFDKFRAEHTEQVCPLNLALSEGYLDGLELSGQLRARLQPCPDTCCVVFDA